MLRTILRVTLLAAALPTVLSAQAVCPNPWRLEQTLVLGTPDDPADFTNVLDLDVGPDGRIYIAQSFVPQVDVYSPQGRRERSIGRAGQGPGEFHMMARKVGTLGDSLWAADLLGVEVFAPNGRPASSVTFRTALPDEGSAFLPYVPLPDGSFLAQRELTGRTLGAYYRRDAFPLLRFSRTGAILDTIAVIPKRAREHYVVMARVPDGLELHVDHPLASWTGVSDLPATLTYDRRAVLTIGDVRIEESRPSLLNPFTRSATGTFDLLRIGIAGDTLLERSIRYEPKRITDREQDWLREAFAANHAGVSVNNPRPSPFEMTSPIIVEQKREAARKAITFPEYFPPVRDVFAGADGTIWLLRELQMDGVDRWEVYDANGQLLGRVDLEEPTDVPWRSGFKMLRATRTELWGMTRGALDVQTVRRFRLRNPCG
jgi:hypothetical protein